MVAMVVRAAILLADAALPRGPVRRALIGGPVPGAAMIRAWANGHEHVRHWRVGALPWLLERLESWRRP
jgi:hypothetical protein